MAATAPMRDPEAEKLERDAFRVLRHLYDTAGPASGVEVPTRGAADALEMEPEYAGRVVRFLEREGLVGVSPAGEEVSITVPGVAYVEHLAWRRRSVRRRWS